ncbi:hypothetical protein FQN57_005109 [Myotisia sp. PD_48]|nr:hypothetical protein FQN57_005109 [Myotisia sp. PD_48]
MSSEGNTNLSRSISPRSSSFSLHATTTGNAATDSSRRSSGSFGRGSPQTARLIERRRSGTLSLNRHDPFISDSNDNHRSSIGSIYRTRSPTSIGGSPSIATGDPHHQRAPSVGEIHQVLEEEQEGQVNRLLSMIRAQQSQLAQMHQAQINDNSGTAVVDDSPAFPNFPSLPIPPNRASFSYPSHGSPVFPNPTTPIISTPTRAQPEVSFGASDPTNWGYMGADGSARRRSREDSEYFENQMVQLTRENMMLRARIQDLERRVAELAPFDPNASLSATRVSANYFMPEPPTSTLPSAAATSTSEPTEQATSQREPRDAALE